MINYINYPNKQEIPKHINDIVNIFKEKLGT